MFNFPLTKNLATTQDRQILQNSDEKQDCQFWILRLVVFTRFLQTDCLLKLYVSYISRDGFRERGALGHLRFWGPHASVTYLVACLKNVKVCPSYVYYPSKLFLLWCRIWFHDCLKFSTESKAFATFLSTTNGNAIFSWNL